MHPVSNASRNSFQINGRHAVRKVLRDGKILTLQPGIFMAKVDTYFVDMPGEFTVMDEKDQVVNPDGRFLISADSIDPFHLVLDYWSR